ncbi:hypothetical protein [Stenotrophomonas sp. AB1(2024)]|uniref:hypothetical protein n=1 Tax=Stenotrophomonas sp. AB1(2024) TaxID=3132215 RepID=UPI0030A1B09D
MNDIESRARELLAAKYRASGSQVKQSFARQLLAGRVEGFEDELAAIVAALTLPNGFALVPGVAMIRYLVVAVFAWALASCILFLLGSFTAATLDPLEWAPPGRFFIALLSLVSGLACGAWAYAKIEDYHRLIRIDLAGREASARWHRDWVRRPEVQS